MDKIMLTTTNGFEGFEITEYIDVLSDRVVLGSGFFSEICASLTDVSGGRSEKFEIKMNELYDHLIESLNNKARKIKADALIGLKVDIDQISGKGNQLFMISGVCTAVKIVPKDNTKILDSNKVIHQYLVKEDMINKKVKVAIKGWIDHAKNTEEVMNYYDLKNYIDKIVEYKTEINFSELLPAILYSLTKRSDLTKLMKDIKKNSRIIVKDEENTEQFLDIVLMVGSEYPEAFESYTLKSNILEEIIEEYINPNYETINNYIDRMTHEYLEWVIFPIILKYKEYFNKQDIQYIQSINKKINSIRIEEPRNPIGFKNYWICSCGNKVPESSEICATCLKNKYGVSKDFIPKLDSVKKFLKDLEEVLVERLK